MPPLTALIIIIIIAAAVPFLLILAWVFCLSLAGQWELVDQWADIDEGQAFGGEYDGARDE